MSRKYTGPTSSSVAIVASASGRRSPRAIPRAMTLAISARRASTTVARNGSPIAALTAICDSRVRITCPNGVSRTAWSAWATHSRSSARVSPTSSTAMWGAASSARSSWASASFDGQRR